RDSFHLVTLTQHSRPALSAVEGYWALLCRASGLASHNVGWKVEDTPLHRVWAMKANPDFALGTSCEAVENCKLERWTSTISKRCTPTIAGPTSACFPLWKS